MDSPPLPETYELDSAERAAATAATAAAGSEPPVAPPPNPFDRKPLPRPLAECNANEIMAHYPNLVAHLICESLGYFTPDSAAYCLRDYRTGRPYWCEWFMDMAERRIGALPTAEVPRDDKGYVQREFYEGMIRTVHVETMRRAFAHRSHHRGFMADYKTARVLIAYRQTPKGARDMGLEFMSW